MSVTPEGRQKQEGYYNVVSLISSIFCYSCEIEVKGRLSNEANPRHISFEIVKCWYAVTVPLQCEWLTLHLIVYLTFCIIIF